MIRTYRAVWLSVAVVLIASAALTPLASGKSKDNGQPKIKGKLVEVGVADSGIQIQPTIKHGWATFRVTNTGTVPHTLNARGTKKTWVLASALAPGQTVLVPIKLQKGVYTVWEPLPPEVAPNALQATVTVN